MEVDRKMTGLIIGLFIGAVLGFVACGILTANDEPEKKHCIDGFETTQGDEWNTDVEDIDEP